MIGPDAKTAVISGGGSASLRPSYTVTPFDAIVEVAKEVLGLEPKDIKYARGGNAHKWAPLFVRLPHLYLGFKIAVTQFEYHRALSFVGRTVPQASTVRGTTWTP